MALKECPTCRVMNRRSATRCRCGHAFDPSTIAKKVARRCPLCGKAEDGAAASCECGYDFATPTADVKGQLVRRNKYGWFWIATGVTAVLAAAGVVLFASILGGVALAASGAWLIARGLMAISWTRGELRELARRELPAARVIEK
jgi:hypothetical protein